MTDSYQETVKDFETSPTDGLSSSVVPALLARYGPNEFELPPEEPLAIKFAKQVYENPLILLLLGSSVVSALMGNYEDAACVVIAVFIVLTGELPDLMVTANGQSDLSRSSDQKSRSRR